MSDVDLDERDEPEEGENRVEDRLDALYDLYALDIKTYSQVLEDSIAHALAPRVGAPAPAAHEVWLPVGPRNVAGRIVALAQDPTDRNVLYAGSAFGGLWRTIDGGDTWQHLGTEEHNFPVSAIAIPESDPTTLFIGTGAAIPRHPSGRGLYKVTVASPRAGADFHRLVGPHPPSLPPNDVNRFPELRGASFRYTRIRMDPFDKDRFWAASQSGLWRWEGRAPAHFVLEFPSAVASGDVATIPGNAVPAGNADYVAYATDVAVARDPRDRTLMPGSSIPRYLILYVAVQSDGVYRGRFDRQEGSTTWERRVPIAFPANFRRIQLALCERVPERVYAAASLPSRLATNVFRSDNNGESWNPTAVRPFVDAVDKQADYDFVLEVHPADPDVVYAGVVEAYLTVDGGASWRQILFRQDYNAGDHAQHADQHAAMFDRFDRRRLWAGHDGGLSVTRDLGLPPRTPGYWRVRSHGIVAGQFQTVNTSPIANRGFMTGGGLQDNGVWLGFGGPTWYHVCFGDGAYLAFDPANVRRLILSDQRRQRTATIVSPVPRPALVNPSVNDLPDGIAPQNSMGVALTVLDGLTTGASTNGPFIPVIAQNRANPAQMILGWRQGASKTTGGVAAPGVAAYSFLTGAGLAVPLNGVAGIAAGTDCTAATFGPQIAAGALEGWVGFGDGTILRTPNAPAGAWTAPAGALPWGGAPPQTQPITDIAVHPTDDHIVAVCSGGTPGRVFISYDRGANWRDLGARVPTGITVTPAAPSLAVVQAMQFTATANFADGSSFDATSAVVWTSSNPGNADFTGRPGEEGLLLGFAAGPTTVTATLTIFGVAVPPGSTNVTVAEAGPALPHQARPGRGFDLQSLPRSPITSLAWDVAGGVTRLFAGTVAGVYVLGPVPPRPAAGPAPAVAINWRPFNQRLPLTLVTDLITVPSTRILRAATFGRGIWDCDLAGTARRQFRLNIRQTVIEDGLAAARPAAPLMADDPRLPAGAAALDYTHAFDIRVDAPPFQFFDDRVDGVEFDERLGADTLVPAATNAIYVQVQNVGRDAIDNVRVHLYFQQSPVAAAPGPASVAIPAFGGAWTRVGSAQTLRSVGPAAPAVARFDWQPPAALAGQNVALVALTTSDGVHDALADAPPPANLSAFVLAERRAALRIVPVAPMPFPDIYIRGSIEDDGRGGASATALRSPDIIIGPGAQADAAAAFADLLDPRPQDKLHGGTPNHIFVRVHNRGRALVHAVVELWAMKIKADLTPDIPNWIPVPSAAGTPTIVFDVPAGGSALGEGVWTPEDPAPTEAQKSYLLVALARSDDNREPLPNKATVNSEDTLMQFLSRAGGSDNVAARAVRWVTP